MHKDDFGDRMKEYERAETDRRFLPLAPVYARIDGRCFSAFTRGMKRPYDIDLSTLMVEVTEFLVHETGALIGYTQSDEISLIWQMPDYKSQLLFDGKVSKMTSVLAALTSVRFMRDAMQIWPARTQRMLPHFDARIFSLPNREEAANAILWREKDATKNSISMAARSVYSHKQLHGKSCGEMQEMLFKAGVNWNDYPAFFKRGSFVQRKRVFRELDEETLARIPLKHQPKGPIERWEVQHIDMPTFTQVVNRGAVIFEGSEPLVSK